MPSNKQEWKKHFESFTTETLVELLDAGTRHDDIIRQILDERDEEIAELWELEEVEIEIWVPQNTPLDLLRIGLYLGCGIASLFLFHEGVRFMSEYLMGSLVVAYLFGSTVLLFLGGLAIAFFLCAGE